MRVLSDGRGTDRNYWFWAFLAGVGWLAIVGAAVVVKYLVEWLAS